MRPTEDLKLALIQGPMAWEQPAENRQRWAKALEPVEGPDLILLPEMFTTGFSMHPAKLGEQFPGPSLTWMQTQAQKKKAVIAGSVMSAEGGQYFNRLLWVEPNGQYRLYDKKHLFSLAGEEKVYSPGRERLVVEYKGWRINPQICFDLRFPVWCRNDADFHLQLFVACWPARRRQAWNALLPARAIENVCYVAGLNRVGEDGNGVYHAGDSAVYDPLGNPQDQAVPGATQVLESTLSAEHLARVREKFAFLEDRDRFQILDEKT